MLVKINGNPIAKYKVSSQYGVTDSVHHIPHSGIDLVMESGTKLYSPADGIIERIVDYGSNNIGKGIIIKTEDGETLIMGHMSDTSQLHIGQQVHTGDFVGLSGNTGRSTGAHLHLGLKDQSGNFINPEKYISSESKWDRFLENGQVDRYNNPELADKNIIEFINDWRKEGFWKAVYGKSFFQVMKDFTEQLLREIGTFIVDNADLFFLLPATFILFATFFIGKNKYSKYIIPLYFSYFITSILRIMI